MPLDLAREVRVFLVGALSATFFSLVGVLTWLAIKRAREDEIATKNFDASTVTFTNAESIGVPFATMAAILERAGGTVVIDGAELVTIDGKVTSSVDPIRRRYTYRFERKTPGPVPIGCVVGGSKRASPNGTTLRHIADTARDTGSGFSIDAPLRDHLRALLELERIVRESAITEQQIDAVVSLLNDADAEREKTGRWSCYSRGGWDGQRFVEVLANLRALRSAHAVLS